MFFSFEGKIMHIKLSSVSVLLQAFALVFSEVEQAVQDEIASQKAITTGSDSTAQANNVTPVS